MIRAIIFDPGDVLYNYRVNRIDEYLIFRKYGYKRHFKVFFDDLEEKIIPCYKGKKDLKSCFRAFAVSAGLKTESDEIVKKIFSRKEKVLSIPGVKRTLAALRKKGILLIALSNATYSAGLKEFLASLSLKNALDACICSCDIGYYRTQPQAFKMTLTRFHLKKDEVIFVGHDHLADLAAAQRFGIRTVAFNTIGRLSAKPDFKIKRFDELVKIVNKLNA